MRHGKRHCTESLAWAREAKNLKNMLQYSSQPSVGQVVALDPNLEMTLRLEQPVLDEIVECDWGGSDWLLHQAHLGSPARLPRTMITHARSYWGGWPLVHIFAQISLWTQLYQVLLGCCQKMALWSLWLHIPVMILHFTKFLTIHNRTLSRYIWYQRCSNMTIVRVMIKSIVAYLNYGHMHACDNYCTKCT